MSDIDIAKRGEQIFSLSFRRTNGRVRVLAKAHPSLEELIKSWGSGYDSSIYDFGGRSWIFEGTPPNVWDLAPTFQGNFPYGDNSYYTLNKPGFDLIDGDGQVDTRTLVRANPVINLSFLRIVGISGGIEFELAGVYSVNYLRDLQAKIQAAIKRLYTDYLLPVDLTLQMNTQETRL